MAKSNKYAIRIKKPSKARLLEILVNNLMWILGSALYSSAIIVFALPNGIAQSGASGVAIILNYLFDTPIGVTNFIINIPLIILAWIFIGGKLVRKTLWVTALLSAMLELFSSNLPEYRGDPLLASLFCGAIAGIGLSMVILRGATTGGTDIVARLVRKVFPHIAFGKVLLATDIVIIIAAALVFKNVESALYAAVTMFISTRTIDYMIYGAGQGKMLMVFTDYPDEIAQRITSDSRRGVSILSAKGGYTGEVKGLVICVVRRSEVHKMNKLIKSVDPKTFTIISEASEMLGGGFKSYTEDL